MEKTGEGDLLHYISCLDGGGERVDDIERAISSIKLLLRKKPKIKWMSRLFLGEAERDFIEVETRSHVGWMIRFRVVFGSSSGMTRDFDFIRGRSLGGRKGLAIRRKPSREGWPM